MYYLGSEEGVRGSGGKRVFRFAGLLDFRLAFSTSQQFNMIQTNCCSRATEDVQHLNTVSLHFMVHVLTLQQAELIIGQVVISFSQMTAYMHSLGKVND